MGGLARAAQKDCKDNPTLPPRSKEDQTVIIHGLTYWPLPRLSSEPAPNFDNVPSEILAASLIMTEPALAGYFARNEHHEYTR